MCGILGILNLDGPRPFDEVRFADALATLDHRGPDARGSQQIGEAALFGHTRLSIIDLSDCSNQPFEILDRYWLTYNGEIFNYLELREELIALGASFRTDGDVEVVVQAYAHWGAECVKRFNGMWAFAIYDTRDQTLFCSRDRFGIKPFNYAISGGRLLFASEIKAIVACEPKLIEPDYAAIANFCRTSVGAQHDRTWFRDVRRLAPGCNLTVRGGRIAIERYWNYPAAGSPGADFEQACEEYAALFRDAVKLRMRSDVPLGITLSAGVDSNSIAYAMHAEDPSPHYCFTARFKPEEGLVQDAAIFVDADKPIDEAVSARKVADELDLSSQVVETEYGEIVGALTKIIYHLESGNSSPAVLPLMQLLAQARKHVTVIMDGQGADELLAGYITMALWPSHLDLVRSGRWREAWASLRQYRETYTLKTSALMGLRYLSNALPVLSSAHQQLSGAAKIYGPKLRGHPHMADWPDLPAAGPETPLGRHLRHSHSGGLVNLLHYGDAISMANSLEARMPFLDHRLVEFVWPLPADFKLKLGVGKHLHREAMRGLVPDRILDNRLKYGFTTPIGNQFRKDDPDGQGPLVVLLSERCLSRGLFDRSGLEALIAAHRSGRRDHGPLLFRLLSTELWFRRFVDGDTVA